jgi:hypothetical protein
MPRKSSILGAERAPAQAVGRDVEALGPSDTSDSGSDVRGELDLAQPTDLDNPIFGSEQPGLDSDSDSGGTGERGAALLDEEADEARDILPDSVHSLADEALASEGVSAEAERELADLSDGEDFASPEDEEDEDRDIDTGR